MDFGGSDGCGWSDDDGAVVVVAVAMGWMVVVGVVDDDSDDDCGSQAVVEFSDGIVVLVPVLDFNTRRTFLPCALI